MKAMFAACVVAALALVPVSQSFADSKGKEKDHKSSSSKAGECPPGLKKKDNGCLPPGQAKKYSRGERVPKDVHYHSIDDYYRYNLTPPLEGTVYGKIADDIYLLDRTTRGIIDVIGNIQKLSQ